MKKNKKSKILIIGLALVIILCAASYILLFKGKTNKLPEEEQKEEPVVVKKLTVYDEDSGTRPFAVMIPNDSWGGAQSRHYGIQKAYMVYEIYAEGNITRFIAFFKDVEIDKIGPIRSARSYFIDYAMESNAIYVHWGQSDGALRDFSNYKIDRIACANYDGTSCPRDKNYSAPNNGFISSKTVYELSEKLGIQTTSKKEDYELLNYSVDELDYSADGSYQAADIINIKYSGIHTVSFTYDADNKYYLRSNSGKSHIDNETGEQIHTKNIIFLGINHKNTYDDKGHIDLLNIGTYDGYYISNGQAIKITATKESRFGKTKYYDMGGNELKVNDGNTFIQLAPYSAITITANELKPTE